MQHLQHTISFQKYFIKIGEKICFGVLHARQLMGHVDQSKKFILITAKANCGKMNRITHACAAIHAYCANLNFSVAKMYFTEKKNLQPVAGQRGLDKHHSDSQTHAISSVASLPIQSRYANFYVFIIIHFFRNLLFSQSINKKILAQRDKICRLATLLHARSY